MIESLLSEREDDMELRFVYATLLLQLGELEAGLQQLLRVRETAAWMPAVEAYIGGAQLALGRVTEAKDTLDEAYARASDNFYVLFKRGELYCRLGVYQVAVEALEAAARAPGEDPAARDAVRRVLRFAREKQRTGFVRNLRALNTGFALNWHWWPVRSRRPSPRADEAWGI